MGRDKEIGNAAKNSPRTGAIADSQSRATKAKKLPADIEAQVMRFRAPARRELRRLIRHSSRFADLAVVFPGAAYVIAARHVDPELREQAVQLVIEGAPLKSVARKLELPTWLRKLPPEAFERQPERLPCGEQFTRRVASRLPQDFRQAPFWLDTVAFASKAAGDDFAIWLAEQPIYSERGQPERLFAVLAVYAWFSRATDCKANELIVVPWRPEIAFDTALCAAKSWLNRMRLIMQLEQGALSDSWLSEGEALGYNFVPLIDRDALLKEAGAMQNCADQYADRLAREKCRLFSVRRKGSHIATLEIGAHGRETGVLTITQLKARHNMPASIEVWQASYAWLAQQTGLKRLPPMIAPDRPFNQKTWRKMMEPYRDRMDGAPWLPRRLTQTNFARLDVDLCELARRTGVSSWLFT